MYRLLVTPFRYLRLIHINYEDGAPRFADQWETKDCVKCLKSSPKECLKIWICQAFLPVIMARLKCATHIRLSDHDRLPHFTIL